MSVYHDSTTNYSNRTVDLLLLQLVTRPVADEVVRPDVSKLPHVVTGIEKLAQRFTLLFLTQRGSVRNRSGEGSDFMTQLGAGNIYDMNTLTSEAYAANKTVATQIRTEDASLATPDDEALETSTIVDLDIDRSKATVYVTIQLESKAGEKYVYTTPVKTGV